MSDKLIYDKPTVTPSHRTLEMCFLGDISLNGNYEKLYDTGMTPFSAIGEALDKSFVVGNLECFSRGNQGVNENKKPRLETSVETLNYVRDFHLNVACLANNHVFDHLEDGFLKTMSFLQQNNIDSIGASLGPDHRRPLILEKQGVEIGLLNYVTSDTNPNPPSDTDIKVNTFELENIVHDIKNLKDQVNHVVLCLHWGGRVEGGMYPDWDQPKTARILIDEGADLVIGHHSHTAQPYEVYKGKYIFYSLGNFCFSDYWFEGKLHVNSRRRMITTIVTVKFNQNNYTLNTSYYKNKNGYYYKIDSYKNIIRLRNLIFKLLKNIKPLWGIYYLSKLYILPVLLFLQRGDITMGDKLKRLIYASKKRI
jgi:hypothetical protein